MFTKTHSIYCNCAIQMPIIRCFVIDSRNHVKNRIHWLVRPITSRRKFWPEVVGDFLVPSKPMINLGPFPTDFGYWALEAMFTRMALYVLSFEWYTFESSSFFQGTPNYAIGGQWALSFMKWLLDIRHSWPIHQKRPNIRYALKLFSESGWFSEKWHFSGGQLAENIAHTTRSEFIAWYEGSDFEAVLRCGRPFGSWERRFGYHGASIF